MRARKTIKKPMAFFCASFMTFFCVACNSSKEESGNGYAALSDVEFWGTYSTEKVLQDNVEIYDDIKQDPALNVSAVGGEEEAAQIIMTTDEKPVKEYNVALSDLTNSNGEIFAKENIKVYHERYIFVGAAGEYYRGTGYFPDCLVPFESVRQVGETSIKAKNNQGLYISFDVPETQAPGTYTGSLQVVIGGESKQIPITLRVVAGSITAETHVKSSFLNEWYFYRGELDTTDEMYEKYNQKLFDYRLGCNDVILYEKKRPDLYAETVCRYAKQIECPGYNIPYFSADYSKNNYELNGRVLVSPHSYNVDLLQKWFKTIAYKGLEEDVDPFRKGFIYGFDEPDLTFGVDKAKEYVKEWSYIVKQCKIIVTEELLADASITNRALLNEILISLEKLPHLVLSSTYLGDNIDLTQEDIVYGPEFQHLQSDGARDTYRLSENNDLWWYGCVNPDYPYPTYHIDDTVLSARLESWMKMDYNIQGNLYWSTCLYSEPSSGGADSGVVYPEDLYSGNAARSLSTNGEGFLFYPGKKYKVDGPLPSIRLEQIRDGLEEYEILYKMREIYASAGSGYTEESVMRYLYDSMYTGTKVGTTSANFEKNRALLLDLFELAYSKAKVCVTNVDVGSGVCKVNVYANEGYQIKQAGEAVSNKTPVNGGNLYTIRLNSGENLNLSVEVEENTYSLAMKFVGESNNYDARYLYDNHVVQKRYGNVGVELVNAVSVIGGEVSEEEQWLKLKLAKSDKTEQDFLLADDRVIKTLHQDADKLVIRLYNSSRETIQAALLVQYGNDTTTYVQYETFQLKPRTNIITMGNIGAKKWSELKYVNRLRITVGQKGDEARECLYLIDMSVYKK